MMVSGGGCLRLTSSLTTGPASFSASTALLCTTSETSTSLTRSTQSLTLCHGAEGQGGRKGRPPKPLPVWANLPALQGWGWGLCAP